MVFPQLLGPLNQQKSCNSYNLGLLLENVVWWISGCRRLEVGEKKTLEKRNARSECGNWIQNLWEIPGRTFFPKNEYLAILCKKTNSRKREHMQWRGGRANTENYVTKKHSCLTLPCPECKFSKLLTRNYFWGSKKLFKKWSTSEGW